MSDMKKGIAIALWLLAAGPGAASAAPIAETKGYRAAFSGFSYAPVERPEGLYGCRDKITAGLKEPGVLNIAVAFGYSDMTDEGYDLVVDGFTKSSLIFNLTNPCVYIGQGFCDFKVAEENEHGISFYTREITAAGRRLTANLYTVSSGYSISNSDNKTIYKGLQNEQTKTAAHSYGLALKSADMVFYEGHSRDGGGPDFAPPRQTASGAVDYSWYRANKPGLKLLLASLAQAQPKPMFLGLYSCASRLHFLDALERQAPEAKLILSTKTVEAGKTKLALLRTLESVLNFECDSDLKARIEGTAFVVE